MADENEIKVLPDVVSDPEEGVGPGSDWTDEGGAMAAGSAEGTEIAPDEAATED